MKPYQLSWNLEDEKKFALQRGGDSPRKEKQLVSSCLDTKDPGVLKYCIQGCQGRCCVERKGKDSG